MFFHFWGFSIIFGVLLDKITKLAKIGPRRSLFEYPHFPHYSYSGKRGVHLADKIQGSNFEKKML